MLIRKGYFECRAGRKRIVNCAGRVPRGNHIVTER